MCGGYTWKGGCGPHGTSPAMSLNLGMGQAGPAILSPQGCSGECSCPLGELGLLPNGTMTSILLGVDHLHSVGCETEGHRSGTFLTLLTSTAEMWTVLWYILQVEGRLSTAL